VEPYLRKLISEGENQKLDFKFCISDSRKIARTLSAFANTDGGRLLIGVRDNGSIAGIRSDEEYYMVETAVDLFCRPAVEFTIKQHVTGGKTILEVEVKKGEKRPYKAKDEEGKWLTYFRNGDQNLLANRVLLQIWRKEAKPLGVFVKFSKPENQLLDYLQEHGSISISMFRKIAAVPSKKAEAIIANLIIFKVLVMKISEKGFTYELNPAESINQ